ncbi:MAG: tryptophan synthase subunit alpha [Thiotrichales bacterium]|nr:tryptophan synthase subunit alpha [Thiotrichales bacterium]
MSRIPDLFSGLQSRRRKALIPFITAGDPGPELTVPLMHALVQGGADVIELGVPFSDPMADGPVIQKSSERALEHNVSLGDVIAMVAEFRKQDTQTPVILMGYLNPIEVMGYDSFTQNAASAGVDGCLIVDLPPEEAADLSPLLKKHGLDQIYLVSPTTSDERLELISRAGSGFLYYVSLKGVTGSNRLDIGAVQKKLDHIRTLTDLPLGVGFGIKDAESAAAVAGISDAVVIGSSLVEHLNTGPQEADKLAGSARDFLAGMRSAMDAA